MSEYEHSQMIRASADRVFAFVSDLNPSEIPSDAA